MKKLLAMLMAAVMVLGMVACGSTTNNGGNNSGNNSGNAGDTGDTGDGGDGGSTGEAGGTFKIGVIGPLTGGAAIYGTCVANSAQIAV